jgi:two-component system NtrC family sensor kinase
MFYPLALPGQLRRSLLLFGGLWLLLVQDNGTGMSPAVQAKIFQPFFTTKPTGESTGLGLSLSHDIIVQGHGGTLSVESRQGVGTEFTIFLPR